MFQRLPPDNYPDDTETARYQNYQPDTRHPWQLRIPLKWRQWLLYGGIGVGILLLSLGGLYLYSAVSGDTDPTPTANIPPPTATPISLVMLGDFPPQVPQHYINIPARIDDTLFLGESRAYTFYAEAGFTWNIILYTAEGFSAQMSLYGLGGQFITSSEGDAGQTVTLNYFVAQEGLYAVLIEGTDSTAGGFTFTMYPADMP